MRINIFYVIVVGGAVAAGIFWLTSRYPLPTQDAAGHESAVLATPPNDVVITTSTSPLAAPTGLQGSLVGGNEIALAWNASTDQNIRYRVMRNNIPQADVTTTWYTDARVVAGDSYGYFIQVVDSLGRTSQPSNFIIVKGPALPTATVPKPRTTTINKNSATGTKNTNTSVPKNTNTTTAINAPKNTNTTTNTNVPTNTNTSTNTNSSPTYVPQNYTVSVSSSGTFSPQSITINATDSITFSYIGSGDEAILSFTPSIGTSVKLDHERRTKTVTFSTPGTYTYHKTDGGTQTGTIIVRSL